MSIRDEFGNKIREIRKAMSLSQEQFAELVGVERKTISSTETKKSFPTAEHLDKISNALNLSYSELFTFKKTAFDAKRPNYEKLQHFITTLSEDEVAYFLDCIKAYIKLKRNSNNTK